MKPIKQLWLLLMLLMNTAFTPAVAEDVTLTINDGTTTNSYAPFPAYRVSSYNTRTQFIIPSTLLSNVDGGMIKSLTFYGNRNVDFSNAYFEVYIMETSFSTFSSTSFSSPSTQVFRAGPTMSNNKMTIPFSAPYEYNGGNLLVEFKQVNSWSSISASSFQWYGVSASNNVLTNISSNTSTSGTGYGFLPKMDIVYEAGGAVAKPKNLVVGNVTKSGATLSWDAVADADGYELYYNTSATAPDENTAATVSDISTNSYALSNLTAEKTYYAYVRAVKGTEKSKWSSGCKFEPTAYVYIEINKDVTTTSSALPVWGGSTSSKTRTQLIIPKSQVTTTAAGASTLEASLPGNPISKLTFYANNISSPVTWGNAKFDVKIGETTTSNFSSSTAYFITSPVPTTVYSGQLTVGTDGKMVIMLDEPFEYTGTNNLLIEFEQTATGTAQSVDWYSAQASTYIGVYGTTSSSSGSRWNYMPKLSFGYLIAPKNLTASNVTKTGATLTWTAAKTETEWQVSYSTTKDDPDNGTKVTVTGTPSTTLSGLTPDITYYVYVRAVENGEYGSWSRVCVVEPSAAVSVDVNKTASSTNGYVPIYGGYVSSTSSRSQFIIPSTYTISTGSGSSTLATLAGTMIKRLTFYANTTSAISWGAAEFNVKLAEVSNTYFNGPQYNSTASTTVYSGSLSVGADGKMVVSFSEPFEYKGGNLLVEFAVKKAGTTSSVNWYYTSSSYIAVYYNGSTSRGSYMPKVTISYLTTPKNVAASNVTMTGATLTWDAAGSETEWQVSYSTTKGDPDNGTLVNNLTSTTCELNGLTPETTYYAYVRAKENGEYGSWSKVCEFEPTAAVTVDVNKTASSSNSYMAPILGQYASYSTNRTQFIIPKTYAITTSAGSSTLQTLAGTKIKRLTFYANTTSAISWDAATFDVKLAEVTATSFSNNTFNTTASTTVYSGKLSVGADGMMVVRFSEPFEYNGGNLLVEFNQTNTGTASTVKWYYTSNSNIGVYQYSTSTSRFSYMPKLTISYLNVPQNVAASITNTGAKISWDAAGSETEWQVSYSTTEGNPDNGTKVSNLTSRTCTLSGLTTGTTYYAYVRAVENGYYGSWSKVCVFTPCTSWTVNNGEATNSYVPVYGQYAGSYNVQSQFIVPKTAMSGGRINKLAFYCSQSSVDWGTNSSFNVYLMETDKDVFSSTSISFTGATKVYTGHLSVENGVMEVSFDEAFRYTGLNNLMISFDETSKYSNSGVSWYGVSTGVNSSLYKYSSSGYQQFLPKMTLYYDISSVDRVQNVTANPVAATTATLSWDAIDGAGYELSYGTTADPEDAGNTVVQDLTNTTHNLTGLTPKTTYYAYVRGKIAGDYGQWSPVCEFTTPALTVVQDGFTLEMNDAGNAFAVTAYDDTSSAPVIPATVSYNETSYPVTTIADEALKSHTALTEITIPSSITSIGTDAFAGCTNIEWVTFQGTTVPTWADGTVGSEFATAATGNTWFVVPEAAASAYSGTYTAWSEFIVTSKAGKNRFTVGDLVYAVSETTATIVGYVGTGSSLTIPATVTIGDPGVEYTVTNIADGVFNNKTSLTLVTFESTTPLTWSDGSLGQEFATNTTTYLVVPEASLTTYKETYTGWASRILTHAPVVQNKITYAISGNTATIINFNSTEYSGDSKVTIPATITVDNVSYNVTNIADNVFYGMYWITSVYFDGATPPTWGDGTKKHEFGSSTYLYVYGENVETYQDTYTAWASKIKARPEFTFSYNTNNMTAQVTGYDGRGGNITIPATTVRESDGQTYTVTGIASGQSNWSFYENTIITGVTFPSTITAINQYAFYGCTELTSVVFLGPTNGTTIGSNAFSGCSKLTTLTLPEGLTTIGSSAFYNCSALTTVTIPSTVTSINSSFYYCSGVTTAIFLPTTPPTWDDANTGYQFNGCANTKLVVPQSENNTVLQAYQTAYPAWYNANAITTSLDNYITVNGLKYAVIEGTSTAKLVGYTADVPAAAVIAASVSNGTDNYTVTTIDEDALKNCTAITSLTIPATVTTISGDPYSSPFLGCTNVTEVHFLGTEPPTWGNEAFKTDFNTPAHTALLVPAAALSTYQSTYTVWMASIYAEGTTIPDLSVFTFGNYAGSGTEYLCTLTGYSGSAANVAIPEYVYYSGTTYKVNAIANEVFKNHTEMTSITIPASVATVGTSAFEGCTSLTAVAIPYSGDHPMINGSAFKGCTSLASVTLPAQLEYISASMFENCSSLTGITLPSTALRFIQSAAFKNSGLTSITLPASLSKDNSGRITRTAFAGCNNLTDVYFEACTVWNDGTNDTQGPAASEFATTANTTLHVPSNSQDETWFLGSYVEWFNQIASDNLFTVGNFRYRHLQSSGGQDYLEVISYLGTEDATVAVPASVTAPNNETYPVVNVGENVFANHTEITQVVLPESVKQVDSNAFAGMDNLGVLIVKNWETTFAIPADASNQFGPNTVIVQPIANLSNNNLGRVISSRPGTRFYSGNHYEYPFVFNCYQNDDDDYVAEVTSYIANDQATVNVPATVTDPTTNTVYAVNQLPEGLFLDHTEVTSVSAPGVTILGTFADGRYRGGYVFPETITSLSLPALVNIPDAAFPTGSISGEWMGAFQRLTNLQSITLTNVQYVGTDAFTGLTNLTTLNLPSVTTLTDHAIINMENCTINMPNCTTITDTMAIAGLKNCTINIPSVTDLRGVALVGVDRLWTNTVENVTINAPGLISIAPGAFKPCTIGTEGIDLSGATLNFDNLENVGNGAFFKTKIGSLTMEKIVSIGDSAFMHAELPNVKIPQTMTSIGKKAFFDCCMDVLRWYSNVDIPDSCFAYNYCMEYATVGDVVVGDFDSTTQSYATTTVGPATIGDGAFMACPFLKDINIGNSVKHLGKNFLKYGRALTQLIIPSTVETIGDGFIQGCDHLRKVYLFNQPAELGGETDDKPIYTIATEGSQAKERDTVYVYSGTTGEVVDTVVYMYDRVIPETFSKKYIHSFMPSANYYVNDGGGLNALIENGFHIGHNDGLFDYVNVNQVRSKSIYYGHLQWNQQSDHYSIHVAVIDSIKPYYNVRYIDGTTSANGVNTYGNENNIMSRLLPTYKLDAQDEPLTGLNVKRLARAGWSKYWTRERAEGVSEYSETNVNPAEHVNNCTFYVLNDETYHRYLNATNVNGEKVWERLDSLSAYNLAGTDGWAHYTGYEMTDELRDKYFQTFSTWSSTGLGLGGYSTDDNDGKVFSQWRRIHPLPNGVYCYPPFTSTQRFTLDGDEYYGYGIGTDFIMPKISLYNRVKREVDARGGAVNYAKWEWSSENLGPGWQPWIDWKNAIGIAYNENYTIVEKDTFNIDYDNHAVQSGYNISELVAWGDGLESPNYPLLGKSGPQIKWQTPCLGNGEATSFGDNYMYTIYFREKNFPHATGTPGEEGFEWGGYRNKYQMVPRADTIPPGWTPTILTPNVPEQSVVAVLRRCTMSETVKNGKNITNYSVHFEIVPKSEWWNNEKYVGKPCLIKNQVPWEYRFEGEVENPYWTADSRVVVPVTQEDGGQEVEGMTLSMIGCKLDHYLDKDEFYCKSKTTTVNGKPYEALLFKLSKDYGTVMVKQFGAYFRLERDGIPVHDMTVSNSQMAPSATSFLFDDEATGIEDDDLISPSDNSGVVVYNLQGRRVSSDLKSLPSGVYIVNGKKTLIKNK